MEYLINKDTYYLMFDAGQTVIKELSTELVVPGNNLMNILDNSCKYYGSSLKGRIVGTKNLINSRYRLPIIVSERNNLLFFPLNGKKNGEVIWFNFNSIKNYSKDGDFVNILFTNGEVEKFMVSYTILNNQIMKCSRMLVIFMNRG